MSGISPLRTACITEKIPFGTHVCEKMINSSLTSKYKSKNFIRANINRLNSKYKKNVRGKTHSNIQYRRMNSIS